MRLSLPRPRFDPYLAVLVGAVATASLAPCRGGVALGFHWGTTAAICLLFFLHGAKLSRQALIGGLGHWRLHLTVLASTFVVFPLLGLAASALAGRSIGPELSAGLLFLCLMPSTVQSSIAFTAVAEGNVAAAVCSASLSNLLGLVVSPLLVSLLMHVQGGVSANAVETILLELLAPFVAGHLARPWLGGLLTRRKQLVSLVDRGSIVLVVYTAFSAAVVEGLWTRLSLAEIAGLALVCAAILACALLATTWAARALGFPRADEVAIVFCGSKTWRPASRWPAPCSPPPRSDRSSCR